MTFENILSPLELPNITIPNRIVVPAMVTRLSGEDGYVNQDIIDRYAKYAHGHVGLIVVEATAIHTSKSGPLLRLSDDEFIAGHRELTKRVHGEGPSKVVPQIIHFMKVARSGWRQTIDMLSDQDIQHIISDFGDAAARAREAGYDGVELHSAHAYTLSSFLSLRNNRKGRWNGRSLEGRLTLFGDVVAEVRRKAGDDFAVGARFLADEMIKDGYSLEDSKRIALRMAQLGMEYISLSVGGKFEDAVHRDGEPLYPYTGYSGDRCMPGATYPKLPHVHYADAIKTYVNSKSYSTPIVSVGKINDPVDAESLLANGQADMIGMARQLLADPDWVRKIEDGRVDQITKCIYCNVCKSLDERFKEVHCFLWPKGYRQAPDDDPSADTPDIGDAADSLTAEYQDGVIKLKWDRAGNKDITGYDVYRAEDDGETICIEAMKGTKYDDKNVLGGLGYTYYIRARTASGKASKPSNSVRIVAPAPAFVE